MLSILHSINAIERALENMIYDWFFFYNNSVFADKLILNEISLLGFSIFDIYSSLTYDVR